ncbi:hypothetical protein NBRC10513_000393 [Rhodotorula toruloides]
MNGSSGAGHKRGAGRADEDFVHKVCAAWHSLYERAQGSSSAAAKRLKPRQPLSCQECRRLKLKCDREFPCANCRKRNCADICPSGTSKPPGRAVRIAAEFSALLKRVDDLEAIVRQLGAGDRIPPPLHLEEATKRSTTITKDLEQEIREGPRDSSRGRTSERSDSGGRFAGSSGVRDEEGEETGVGSADEGIESVMVGVGSLSIADSGRTRFLGAAAGSAYFYPDPNDEEDADASSLASEAEREVPAADQVIRYPYIQLGTAYSKTAELERLRAFLPDEAEGRRVSENYWRYLAFQFTPLEEAVFWEDYWPSAYTSHDPHGTKLACVFMILSLGHLFDPDAPSTPNPDAQHFFILSHAALAASRFLANSTLAAVQTLQLSANFHPNYHDLREGGETFFPILGMAVRMLATQGLHRDGSNFGLTGAELNRRRRVFYELLTLERMQAFISGRPHMFRDTHFDTQMPENASVFDRAKWQIGILIAKVIDQAFSVATPSYSTILSLDQDMRNLVRDTPPANRSGALPPDSFLVKPQGIPQLPPGPPPEAASYDLITRMRAHTLDQMFGQVLFYLHKPAFAQALLKYSDEPLKSPWAASVAAVSLETAVYLLAVAKSFFQLHPVLSPRWWHIWFHAFAGSVAQSSLVIKSPRSMLAPHAWSQLNEAVALFEAAGADGAPVAAFVPRLRVLREKAFLSLQNAISVPLGLMDPHSSTDVGDSLAEGTDVSLSILCPPTRLERKQRKKSVVRSSSAGKATGSASPAGDSPTTVLAQMLGATPALSEQAPPVTTAWPSSPVEAEPYNPFDSRIAMPGFVGGTKSPPVVSAPYDAATLAYLTAAQQPPPNNPVAQFPPVAFLPHQPLPHPLRESYEHADVQGPSKTAMAYAAAAAASSSAYSLSAGAPSSSDIRPQVPPLPPQAQPVDPSTVQQDPLGMLRQTALLAAHAPPPSSSAPGVSSGVPGFSPFAGLSPGYGFGGLITPWPAYGEVQAGEGATGAGAVSGAPAESWPWFDVLGAGANGGSGGAAGPGMPSPLDFSRFPG